MGLCDAGISANITSDCTTSLSGGLEVTAYAINRADIDFDSLARTRSKVSALILNLGKKAFVLKGIKKLFVAGSESVTADNRPKKFTHSFHLEGFEISAAANENITDMEDVVIITELKDKGTAGDGEFVILGLTQGLYGSTDSWNSNENNGARMIDLTSMAGNEEPEERFILDAGSRATTLALIATLLIPAV